jgi:membrane protein implicated in regulation of membrane protease activity
VGDIPSWAAWLLVALVLLGAEALTLQFVLIYFGLGALVAAAASPFIGTAGQGLVFAVGSVVLMVLTRRPLIAWSGRRRGAATDVEAIAGSSAVVTIAVDNHANTGQVRVGAEHWTARTPGDDDPPIAPGAVVRIESIAGVTVRVVPSQADRLGGGGSQSAAS